MGFISFLGSPKKEEQQQVPENDVTDFEGYHGGGDMTKADHFGGHLFGQEDDGNDDDDMLMFCGNVSNEFLWNRDFLKCEDIVEVEEEAQFWDVEDATTNLNLNLNYQEVLDAWSDRGSLFARDHSASPTRSGSYMGEVPEMEDDRSSGSGRKRREASVQRYKEKRKSRLFSKKIRYEVRKLNADARPRLKGRFVKKHQ